MSGNGPPKYKIGAYIVVECGGFQLSMRVTTAGLTTEGPVYGLQVVPQHIAIALEKDLKVLGVDQGDTDG